jgi:hypothetical protein
MDYQLLINLGEMLGVPTDPFHGKYPALASTEMAQLARCISETSKPP